MRFSNLIRNTVLIFIVSVFFQVTLVVFARSTENAFHEHKVTIGENLWKLSEKYLLHGISFPHLAKKNSDFVTDPDLIYPGDVLKIPRCETNFECRDRKNFLTHAGDMQKARSSFGTLIVENGWKARWRALDVTLKALDQGNAAGGWDVSAGINREAIATLLSTAVGSKLVNKGNGFLNGTEVTVDDIALVPSLASLDALVKVTAKKGPLSLSLLMEGSVLVSRIEYDRDEEGKEIARVVFNIEPLKVQPLTRIGRLSQEANGFWSKLAPDLARTLLNPEIFETDIEIPAEFKIRIGIDEEQSTEIGHDSVLIYQVSMEEAEFRSAVSYAAPVYSGNAIWLMGKLRTDNHVNISPDIVPNVSAVELRLAVQEKYEILQTKLPPELLALGAENEAPKFAVRVQNRLFRDLTGKLANLTPEQRRISFNLHSSEGHLTLEEWWDKNLGRGGVWTYVRNCKGCARATVELGKPSIKTDNGTIGLSLPVNAKGFLALGMHVDPLIGGGAGTSVGIDVETRNTQIAKVNAAPLIIKDLEGRGSAVLEWRATCQKLDIEALTDGKVKIGSNWASAPKAGARIKAPMEPGVLEPILLFDSKPELILFPQPKPAGKSRWSRDWWIVTRNVGVSASLLPAVFTADADAVFVTADLHVKATPRPTDDMSGEASARFIEQLKKDNEQQRAQVNAATQAALKAHARNSVCSTGLEIAVLIGDFEFGPNHELIKFLSNAWSDITKGPGQNNELVKFLDTIGISRSVQAKIGSELSLNKVEGWVNNPVDSFRRGELGRQLENLGIGF